jgi:porin
VTDEFNVSCVRNVAQPRLWIAASLVGAGLWLAAGTAGAAPANGGVETAQSPQEAQPQLPPASPPAPPHLFGDWGGVRTRLGDVGIDLEVDYTTETAGNVSGGRRLGADFAQQIGLTGNIDWEKLAGVPGFSTHAVFINRAGRNASSDYIGDPVIQAQEIYGAGFNMGAKLVYLYAEEKLLKGRVDLAAGRLAVGADFAASPLYCNFMTLTICGHPRALTSNQGFSDWPTASWGGRIRAQLTTNTRIIAGVYESEPFPAGGRSGWDWTTRHATGEIFPVELGWDPTFGPNKLPGHYKLGVAYDNSRFPDDFLDAAGQPFVISGAAARRDHGRTSVWVTADQMLVRHGTGPQDGVTLLAAYAHNNPDVSLFEQFAWVGLLDRGFWTARPHDRIGIGFTYYRLSPSLTAREALQETLALPFTDGEQGVQSDASVIEANYDIPVYRGVDVQPEIEYFIRPGGQRVVPNSLVLGLKTHMLF